MAAFPPFQQIVGSHGYVYEAYFSQADPTGSGSIGALDAAMFLKKSGLNDTILSQIWDLSDPSGKGYLEKPGFCVALKMISLVQSGQDLNISKLTMDTPAPNLGPVPEQQSSPSLTASTIPWAIQAQDKAKYDQVFDNLTPVNGMLSGDKVRPVLMNSKLPVDVLGRVWELSDIDQDGFLDRDEFAVAMHLVYRALENDPVPMTLPPRLIPPSKRKGGGRPPLPGAVPVLPGSVPVLPVAGGRASPSVSADSQAKTATWVVNAADKLNYDAIFKKADTDNDGLVTGADVRDIFLQSGLHNTVLAHIWSLCDIKGSGKLNNEQFALAMHLMQLKMKGVDPPAQLTPEMIPPTLRPKPGSDPGAFGVVDGTNSGPYSHVADFSAIKELDLITKEIDDIKRDKIKEEKNRSQYEADIKIRNGEVQTAQKELDSITATLQQLENQKKEAQKRLDELDDKRSNLERNVKEYEEKCQEEEKQINALKSQITNQEKSVKEQEEELNKLRLELNSLRDTESQLEQSVEAGKQQLELLAKSHKDIHLQINQAKTKIQHMQDQQRALAQSIGSYSNQYNGEWSSTPFASDTDVLSTRATAGSSPVSTMSNFSMGSTVEDFKEDPFKGKDPFSSSGEASNIDPFQNDDPFKENDPFKSDTFASDPFASEDPFKEAFPSVAPTNAAQNDPFADGDPFSGAFSSPKAKSGVSFDPFGGGSASGGSQKAGADLFGSDPFSPKSRSKRTESPTPALPPKQKKQPPPRPAPPRPKLSPATTKPTDPFGSDPFAGTDPFASSTASSDAFANFADFSPSKFAGEEQEMAWAMKESKKLDKERKRQQRKEESDLKMALALSKRASKRESEA